MAARAHSRHARGHAEGGHENSERWLLTYADLITLLMVFFVVLYSMSRTDSVRFHRVSAALEQAFNVDVLRGRSASSVLEEGGGGPSIVMDIAPNASGALLSEANRLKSVLDGVVTRAPVNAPAVRVSVERDGVVVQISGSFLFDSGHAELKPSALLLLDALSDEIRRLPNDVRVEGHTDDIPTASPRFPTNWELSSARALSVVRYLTEVRGLPAGRLAAAGFGEFRPVVPNDARENRARNRRVEIRILSQPPDPAPAQTWPSSNVVREAS